MIAKALNIDGVKYFVSFHPYTILHFEDEVKIAKLILKELGFAFSHRSAWTNSQSAMFLLFVWQLIDRAVKTDHN